MLSTADLKQLLAQATDGPWTGEPSHGGIPILAPETKFFIAGIHPRDVGTATGEANARLAALAPELAAEVIRLREALHAEIEVSHKRANKCDAKFSFESAAWHREKAGNLRQILEGGQP